MQDIGGHCKDFHFSIEITEKLFNRFQQKCGMN